MPMKAMTALTELDNKLTTLRADLHNRAWEPGELVAIRAEIDLLLEQRQALTGASS